MPGVECKVMQGDVVDAGIPSDNTKVIMMPFQPAADFVRSSCGIGMKSWRTHAAMRMSAMTIEKRMH